MNETWIDIGNYFRMIMIVVGRSGKSYLSQMIKSAYNSVFFLIIQT